MFSNGNGYLHDLPDPLSQRFVQLTIFYGLKRNTPFWIKCNWAALISSQNLPPPRACHGMFEFADGSPHPFFPLSFSSSSSSSIRELCPRLDLTRVLEPSRSFCLTILWQLSEQLYSHTQNQTNQKQNQSLPRSQVVSTDMTIDALCLDTSWEGIFQFTALGPL